MDNLNLGLHLKLKKNAVYDFPNVYLFYKAIPNQGNEHLQRSIIMANAYLKENAFRLILGHFDIDRQTVATQTAHIAIEQMAHDGSRWAATNPVTGVENLTIYISDYFIRRIQRKLHYIKF